MERRRAGLALLLAAVLLVALPRLLSPTQIAGVAIAQMPEPPQVGDCLKLDDTTVLAVSCDEPHYAEVTARWAADDPDRPGLGNVEACATAADAYVNFAGELANDWHLPLYVAPQQIEAPRFERIKSRGWTACTVTVTRDGTLFTGSLRSLTPTDRPLATTLCFLDDGPPGKLVVPCDRRHDGEQLANIWRRVADPGGTPAPPNSDGSYDVATARAAVPPEVAAELDAQCVALAAGLLETADPTRGGALQLRTDPLYYEAGPTDPTAATLTAGCSISSTDGRRLTGTVIGLGAAPVPFE